MTKLLIGSVGRMRDIFTILFQNHGIIFHNMQVDYSKLWGRFKELGHKNKTDLIEMASISTDGKNYNITYYALQN